MRLLHCTHVGTAPTVRLYAVRERHGKNHTSQQLVGDLAVAEETTMWVEPVFSQNSMHWTVQQSSAVHVIRPMHCSIRASCCCLALPHSLRHTGETDLVSWQVEIPLAVNDLPQLSHVEGLCLSRQLGRVEP